MGVVTGDGAGVLLSAVAVAGTGAGSRQPVREREEAGQTTRTKRTKIFTLGELHQYMQPFLRIPVPRLLPLGPFRRLAVATTGFLRTGVIRALDKFVRATAAFFPPFNLFAFLRVSSPTRPSRRPCTQGRVVGG